jgi:hypothetical protein
MTVGIQEIVVILFVVAFLGVMALIGRRMRQR